MKRRLKVLVSAYACSPVRGSEPGIGWEFVKAIAEHHDLWVLTEQEKFQTEIESELEKHPELCERIRFFYLPKKRGRRLRKIWPPSYYWFYRKWHKKALDLACELHAEVKFDLVHQLNMVGFREPGYFWQMDLPFVWGPIGGAQNVPWAFLPTMGFKGMFFHGARNIMNRLQQRFLTRPRKAAKRAGEQGLIAATTQDQLAVRQYWEVESTLIGEIGTPPTAMPPLVDRQPGEPLRIVWSGLHIPRKALNLLLQALQKLPAEVEWQLDILGEGACTPKWKSLAKKLGVDAGCRWHGWVTRDKAVAVVEAGHLFAITSLQDLTSTVTLEAMISGLPIVCLDHCGFADVVTEACGIRIPVTRPQKAISQLSDAVAKLYNNESERKSMAIAARERALQYSWKIKGEQVSDVYWNSVEKG